MRNGTAQMEQSWHLPMSSTAQKKTRRQRLLCQGASHPAHGRDPVKGAIGSVENANFARSAFTVLRFPEVPSIKILLHSKANCGPYGRTLAYRIVDQKIEWYDEEDISEDSALVKFIQKYSILFYVNI